MRPSLITLKNLKTFTQLIPTIQRKKYLNVENNEFRLQYFWAVFQ